MEFSIFCPYDGRVEVGLEQIANVILHDAECVDVVFNCPVCGEEIKIQLRIPNLLVTAMELVELAEGRPTSERFMMVRGSADDSASADADELLTEHVESPGPALEQDLEQDARIEGYCEYFRRQLAAADSVEAMLAEMDM